MSIQNDVDLLRIRAERTNSEAVFQPVRSKNPKRVGMGTGKKAVELVGRQSGDFKTFHARGKLRFWQALFNETM